MIHRKYVEVLRTICNRLSGSKVIWALMGSANLSLQGVPIEPNDIDLQTDEAGAYEIERSLSEYVTTRVALSTADKIRSYFGALLIDGVKVHIVGDLQIRFQNGKWEKPLKWDEHKQYVEIDDIRIPVLSLEHEHQIHLRLGKLDRAQIIKVVVEEKHNG